MSFFVIHGGWNDMWPYDRVFDRDFDFEETMHRTLGMVAIRDGLLVIADLSGLIHCLDPACVMRSSTYVEDVDQKTGDFCDHCLIQLNAKLERLR